MFLTAISVNPPVLLNCKQQIQSKYHKKDVLKKQNNNSSKADMHACMHHHDEQDLQQ